MVTFQVLPQSLNGVEFRAVSRQIQQADILRNLQGLGRVPAGLIQHKYNVGTGACLLADELQMMIHIIGIHRRS